MSCSRGFSTKSVVGSATGDVERCDEAPSGDPLHVHDGLERSHPEPPAAPPSDPPACPRVQPPSEGEQVRARVTAGVQRSGRGPPLCRGIGLDERPEPTRQTSAHRRDGGAPTTLRWWLPPRRGRGLPGELRKRAHARCAFRRALPLGASSRPLPAHVELGRRATTRTGSRTDRETTSSGRRHMQPCRSPRARALGPGGRDRTGPRSFLERATR